MKAIVQDRFGPPEVLRLADTDLHEVGADDVLVRVHAAALNPADWHILPARQNRQELLAVTGLIQDGKLLPVVDRTYPLAEAVEGLRTLEQGHARGKIVVTVA